MMCEKGGDETGSVAEPKLFIFGSDFGSTFVHNFGSGSDSSSATLL